MQNKKYELVIEISGMIFDINSIEIDSHIDDKTLNDWLTKWRSEILQKLLSLYSFQ